MTQIGLVGRVSNLTVTDFSPEYGVDGNRILPVKLDLARC